MDVRITRLTSDKQKIDDLLASNSVITLAEAVGSPPVRYLFDYAVEGLTKDKKTHRVSPQKGFQVELTLTEAYPRLPPQCRMVTPAFHPNIVPDAICVTDYWSAGSSLTRLIVRIGELLAYQSFGLKYPLNAEAATWVESHLHELPTDTTDFVALLHAAEGIRRGSEEDIRPTDSCIGCGITAEETHVQLTESHNIVCDNCLLPCSHCGIVMSEKSPHEHCEVCTEAVCYKCIHRCLNCGILVCFGHMTKCGICDLGHCPTCSRTCDACGTHTCAEHAGPAQREGKEVTLCEKCLLEQS